jgi:hypothetical protein
VAAINRAMGVIVFAAFLALLGGCASSAAADSADIPAPLRVSAADLSTLRTHAVGVQIYQCRAGKDGAARFEWQLKEPSADLYDKKGNKIGRHYAGPTWESNDGSKVVGEVVARADSPEPGAIAWLLLSAKSTSGNGVFGGVHFIQRLHTAGGNAPAGGCDQAGKELRVSYSADYWFYVAKR